MRYSSGVLLRRSLWRLGHSRALSGLTGTDAVFGGLVASMRWRGRAAWHCAPRGMHGKDNAGASGRAGGRGPVEGLDIALALASPGTCTCAWRSCNPLRQPIAVVGGTESLFVNHILWAMSLDHSVRPAARDIIGTAMRRWPALLPSDTSHAPPPPPPNACVTCRRVAAPSQGPGQSPVLLFRVQRQVTAPPPIGRQPRPPRGPSGPQASAPQHNPQQPASRGLRCNSASQTAPSAGHHHRQGPPSGSHTTR